MKRKPSRIEPKERQIQAAICAALKLMLPGDARCYAIPGGDRGVTLTPGYVAGTPDLLVIHHGRALFLEVKREGEYLRPEQREQHNIISECGCNVAVVRSIEDAAEFLGACGVPLAGATGLPKTISKARAA